MNSLAQFEKRVFAAALVSQVREHGVRGLDKGKALRALEELCTIAGQKVQFEPAARGMCVFAEHAHVATMVSHHLEIAISESFGGALCSAGNARHIVDTDTKEDGWCVIVSFSWDLVDAHARECP